MPPPLTAELLLTTQPTSALDDTAPPEPAQLFATSTQLFNIELSAPPPAEPVAVFFKSVQLTKTLEIAPPPAGAELLVKRQPMIVPRNAPPQPLLAILPMK